MFKKLFGEKCCRCESKLTREAVDDLPVCSDCQLLIQAEQESFRSCPDCQCNMEKTVVMNVVVDKCGQCGGAWLDAGELELMAKGVEAGGGDFATGMALGMCLG